jgi:hypothetical protein
LINQDPSTSQLFNDFPEIYLEINDHDMKIFLLYTN